MQTYSPTPKALSFLIWLIVGVSLLVTFFDYLAPFKINAMKILSLSSYGIHHSFYWQFLTNFLIIPASGGPSFSFVFSLFFNSYILWMIGKSLIQNKGIGSFFWLYFLSGIFSSFFVFLIQDLAQQPILYTGNWACLYALLIAYLMTNPNSFFFLLLPVKAKWLITFILGAGILLDLAAENWTSAIANSTASLFSYFYSLLIWRSLSPFLQLNRFENFLLSLFYRKSFSRETSYSKAKIYDFKTGKALQNDDEFLEEMLTKISLKGKKSLSWSQRRRLKRIAREKKKN
ncbi:MAG: rhomboid family intramembrane serine protease [Anaerolineae bacterium]